KLIADAKKAKKPLVMLDDNTNKFKNFETDVTAKDLEKLLKFPQPVAHATMCFQAARAAFLSGEEQSFKVYNNGCETVGTLARLQQRTTSWIPKLEPLLKEGGAFAVVGADHMHGANGLEAQLKARGYSVTRVEQYSNPLMTGGGQVTAPVARAPVGASR
ncbi:MAG: TraB/GumN family protein, partial [Pseudobdellovibrio sp.]